MRLGLHLARRRKQDLKDLCAGQDRWCIMLLSAIKNKNNKDDFHFPHAQKDGVKPTVADMDTYLRLFGAIQALMQKEFQLSAVQTARFPLLPSNLGYKLNNEYGCKNAFTIRVSTKLLCFDARVHSVLYRMAEVINEQLHGQGMIDSDRKDFEERLFGYPEVAKK